MDKDQTNLKLNMDLDVADSIKQIKEDMRKRMLEEATKVIDNMLLSPREIASMERHEIQKLNQQSGILHHRIKESVEGFMHDYLLSGKLDEYIARNAPKAVEAALNAAIEHKAKSLAFRKVKTSNLGIPDIPLFGD